MYRYAQVEDALLKVHDLREEVRGALRGRIKNLQRLGVASESPGKGSRISYEFNDVCLLGLCLEFAQFGMDPTKIALVKERIWPSVVDFFQSDDGGEDMILIVLPRFFTETLESRSLLGHRIETMTNMNDDQENWVFPISFLPQVFEARAMLINVSNLRGRIWSALNEILEQNQ